MVESILKKYDTNLKGFPKSISNQKFNQYIKEVLKIVGFTQNGRLISEPEKPLYDCVSSHTCRRSFITNLYLDGCSLYDIMKISGHRTEKALLTYIKVSNIRVAQRVNEHQKRMWN